MEPAIIFGARANELGALFGGGARACSSAAELTDCALLALTWDALDGPLPQGLRVHTLLLPGGGDTACLRGVRAFQLAGYGFSPRDTLTLSSVSEAGGQFCVQRSLLTPDGTVIEPQEFPLPPRFAALPGEHALLLTGLDFLLESQIRRPAGV